jgi:hypothetical protein
VLLITTGSKASDIPREAELLPGRKGKLARTIYLFVQLPYKIFYDKAFPTLKAQTLPAYLIAGGSPPATLAEESGMANNTVAHGYLHLLSDLLVGPWEFSPPPCGESAAIGILMVPV